MKSNAPGQFLGYSIQFPRALFHLLTCSPGDRVCVEVLGDVATQKSDGSLLTEEDKSSLVGNPITNKSTDLWKTFFNWIKAVNDNEIVITNTKFVLYCNKSGRPGIVDKFNSATDESQIKAAIEYAKTELSDIDEEHDVWEFYNYVVNENKNILIGMIERFEFQLGEGTSYDELRKELIRKRIPDSQLEFVLDELLGWLQKDILTKISSKKQAIVSWEEYSHRFTVLFERSRSRELIDFTLRFPLGLEEINNQIKSRPTYVKQLDIIGMNEDDIIKAVTDFMRASINRGKWIEAEIIDEDIASDFESRLNRYWNNRRRGINITYSDKSEKDRGQLLYSDCMERTETIRDMSPPDSTISGTYHALADCPVLGWHPDWQQKIEK